MTKELLETRTLVKKRKPTYKRTQHNQFAKFKNDVKWRRPKGMGNKDRRNRKGHIGTLRVGYGSPSALRGANKQGLFEVMINRVEDLELVDSKTQIGVISATVGGRKKVDIMKAAQAKKMNLANVKDIATSLKSLEKSPKTTTKAAAPAKKVETKKEEAKK
jgi:large subunit ribosomal protein L32e